MKLVVNFNEKTGEMNVNIEENEKLNNVQEVASYTAIMKKLIRRTVEDIIADMDETEEKKRKITKKNKRCDIRRSKSSTNTKKYKRWRKRKNGNKLYDFTNNRQFNVGGRRQWQIRY